MLILDWGDIMRYGLLRMLRRRKSLLTPNIPKAKLLHVRTEARSSQSGVASLLRRQGATSQECMVHNKYLEHEDNFDPEDKLTDMHGPQDASPFLVLPPTSLSLDLLPCNLGTLLEQIQKVPKKNLDVLKALKKNLEVLKVQEKSLYGICQKSVKKDPTCTPELFSLACGPNVIARSFIACLDDQDVIHGGISFDVALFNEFLDLDDTILSTNDESMEVDVSLDNEVRDDDDDFIYDIDDVAHDIGSDDEVDPTDDEFAEVGPARIDVVSSDEDD
ncbi:hypothetical protein Tco_1029617 [Tanacetum coccineum]|uniref:Uncharacterized protein n=1 Tax=Tanacetum coccineum TaxID=301880 RepID=A0ABQ5G4F8_9ASTR